MTPTQNTVPEWALWVIAYFTLNVCVLAWVHPRGTSEPGAKVIALALGLPLLALGAAWALVIILIKGPGAFKKHPEDDPDNVIKFRGKE